MLSYRSIVRVLAAVHLVIHHPAHVFEVAIIEEYRTVEFHPRTQLLHTDRANFRKHVPARAQKQNERRSV